MRITKYIAIFLIISSCNPDGLGCFEHSGKSETTLINVEDFTSIDISGNIDLKLNSSAESSLILTTGKNVAKGIRVEVIDGVLYLDNLNRCDWTRKYNNPLVEISSVSLARIHSRGYGHITSSSTLSYNQLELINEAGSADFTLSLNVRKLRIVSNDVSNFYISGAADHVEVNFYFTDGIFFGQGLRAMNASVYHIGSNAIHLNVTDSISGEIASLGNVFIHQQMPLAVDLIESSSGRLIFNQ